MLQSCCVKISCNAVGAYIAVEFHDAYGVFWLLPPSQVGGGNVFTSVCLSVCLYGKRITQKITGGF